MATSKLQRKFGDMLDANFPQFHIYENHRPDWMLSEDYARLELDFYIEEIKTAFEVQGGQHYQYVPFFHGSIEKYEEQKRRDEQKEIICRNREVKLVKIYTETDAEVAIKNLLEKYGEYNPRRIWKKDIKIGGRTWTKADPNRDRQDRLRRVQENLKKYENGELIVPIKKYNYWIKVIELDGRSPQEGEL